MAFQSMQTAYLDRRSFARAPRTTQRDGDELRVLREALARETASRLRAERQLRETEAVLSHAARLTAMGTLTASLAHEINQPLAAIAANAGACRRWLEGDADIAEAKDAAQRISACVEHAAQVTGRIRAMLKKTPPARAALDIEDVIEDALALLRCDLDHRGIALEVRFAGALPPVHGDKVQLQQVLLNLVLNAAEACTESGHILVRTQHSGEDVEIAVADNGRGLPMGDVARLFEPFVTAKSNGTGLGLAICRSIVAAHGGTLTAQNNPEGGAIFRVRLPTMRQEP